MGKTKKFEQIESIVIVAPSGEIVKTLNYNFEKYFNATYSLLVSCLQDKNINSWIGNLFYKYLQDTFVEMYAGLNISFEYLGKAKVACFGLCLSNVIQLRQYFFAESSHQFIAASMVDNHLIESVKKTNSPHYIFVVQGLRMYLSRQQLKQLFDKLIENFFDSLFAFDYMSPLKVKINSVMIQSNICQQIWTGTFQIFARFKTGTPVIG